MKDIREKSEYELSTEKEERAALILVRDNNMKWYACRKCGKLFEEYDQVLQKGSTIHCPLMRRRWYGLLKPCGVQIYGGYNADFRNYYHLLPKQSE